MNRSRLTRTRRLIERDAAVIVTGCVITTAPNHPLQRARRQSLLADVVSSAGAGKLQPSDLLRVLDLGISVDAVAGSTNALRAAVDGKHGAMVAMLLAAGASPNATNANGSTVVYRYALTRPRLRVGSLSCCRHSRHHLAIDASSLFVLIGSAQRGRGEQSGHPANAVVKWRYRKCERRQVGWLDAAAGGD
jgi:hypothetical protein